MPLIFSTLTNSNEYTFYKDGTRDVSQRLGSVVIKGGANNVDRKNLQTPRGVATSVTDAELEMLMNNEVFLLHKENGFITIDAVKDARDADKAAESMQGRDDAAPLTEGDYAEGKAPHVNKDEEASAPVVPTTPPPRGGRRSN